MADETRAQEEAEDLTPEEKEQRFHDQLVQNCDQVLGRWHQGQPEETRQAIIDGYIESGTLDHAAAGVEEIEADVVQAAFHAHVERTILKPLGMSVAQWSEHIDEADLPEFRRAVVEGNWQLLIDHARAAAKLRLDLGI